MSLNVYYDLMSPPARAVIIVLRLNHVQYEGRPVALRKGEQYGQEYKKINPLSKIPAIDDNGFKLSESITILKYLAQKYELPEHWYPCKDFKKQALVNEYLDWHHFNMRYACLYLLREKLMIPQTTGNPVNERKADEFRANVVKIISDFESYFLKGSKFIAGSEISIADIVAVCELTELLACHEHDVYKNSPITNAWVERVREATNPIFDEAHQIIYLAQKVYKKNIAKL
ncbi:glutathione S-transferase theta-1 [Elysia marginata]|uniref:Glutathione S-transferase theta-1 n=1 Tax=Elysia marginata TaxID=1093978 RepID=A0AAV4FKJ7_9GAST|nr:glutathione S-transferase theta-1 [Elysia marginata]